MTWTMQQITDAVARIDVGDEPIDYHVEGSSIVGAWHLDMSWSGPAGAGARLSRYRVRVEVDEEKATYDYSEDSSESGRGLGAGNDGVSAHAEASAFHGKQIKKSFGADAAPQMEVNGRDGRAFSYTFDTQRIKKPLFELLEEGGYQRSGGLLSRLFGS